jgi:SH3-like domain-containing protein
MNAQKWTGRGAAVILTLWAASETAAQELATALRPVARPASLVIPETALAAGDAAMAAATEAALLQASTTSADAVASTEDVALASAEGAFPGPALGPETNLPIPRYVSLKTNEGNVRRGPSLSHRIDWVFVREDMPLQITAEYGHWRRVADREGLGGWVHYSLLSGTRTVIVDQDMLPLLYRPQDDAGENALLEQGVIAFLDECTVDWCQIHAGGYAGWVRKTALWGVDADEIRE